MKPGPFVQHCMHVTSRTKCQKRRVGEETGVDHEGKVLDREAAVVGERGNEGGSAAVDSAVRLSGSSVVARNKGGVLNARTRAHTTDCGRLLRESKQSSSTPRGGRRRSHTDALARTARQSQRRAYVRSSRQVWVSAPIPPDCLPARSLFCVGVVVRRLRARDSRPKPPPSRRRSRRQQRQTEEEEETERGLARP